MAVNIDSRSCKIPETQIFAYPAILYGFPVFVNRETAYAMVQSAYNQFFRFTYVVKDHYCLKYSAEMMSRFHFIRMEPPSFVQYILLPDCFRRSRVSFAG